MQRVLQCRRAANETSVVRELSGGHEMVFWGLMWLCTREMRKEMANNLMIYIICCNNGALARARWRYSSQNAAKICNSFRRPFPSFQLATCKWYKSHWTERARDKRTYIFIWFSQIHGKKMFRARLRCCYWLPSTFPSLPSIGIHVQMCTLQWFDSGEPVPRHGQFWPHVILSSTASDSEHNTAAACIKLNENIIIFIIILHFIRSIERFLRLLCSLVLFFSGSHITRVLQLNSMGK